MFKTQHDAVTCGTNDSGDLLVTAQMLGQLGSCPLQG